MKKKKTMLDMVGKPIKNPQYFCKLNINDVEESGTTTKEMKITIPSKELIEDTLNLKLPDSEDELRLLDEYIKNSKQK